MFAEARSTPAGRDHPRGSAARAPARRARGGGIDAAGRGPREGGRHRSGLETCSERRRNGLERRAMCRRARVGAAGGAALRGGGARRARAAGAPGGAGLEEGGWEEEGIGTKWEGARGRGAGRKSEVRWKGGGCGREGGDPEERRGAPRRAARKGRARPRAEPRGEKVRGPGGRGRRGWRWRGVAGGPIRADGAASFESRGGSRGTWGGGGRAEACCRVAVRSGRGPRRGYVAGGVREAGARTRRARRADATRAPASPARAPALSPPPPAPPSARRPPVGRA